MNSLLKKYVFFTFGLCVFCAELRGDALDVAREALRDKLYRVAQMNAEKALDEEGLGDRIRALEILLESLARQHKYMEMLRALESNGDAVIDAPESESLLYWRVLALFNTEQLDDVANIINSGRVGTNTAFGVTTLRIGARTRELTGDVPGAIELYKLVDSVFINEAIRSANAYEWAVLLNEHGRYEEALDVLKSLAQMELNNDNVHDGALLRGRILMRLGRDDEAARVMDALAMNERVAEVPRVEALVEMSVYKLDSALTNEAVAYARSAYSRAQLPQTRRLAGYWLGDLLCHSGQTVNEGAQLIKNLVREFPEEEESRKAHLKLADSFLNLSMPSEAAAEYRIFLETYPSSTLDNRVMRGRGWALFQLKRYTEAGVAFAKAAELSVDPEEKAQCLFKKCDALMAENRFVDAASSYLEINAQLPDTSLAGLALFRSAEALERENLLNDALTRYRETARRYPHRDVAAEALLRVAAIQADDREIDQAIDTYGQIIGKFTNTMFVAQAHMGRGRSYYSKYQFENAMQEFAAVAEIDPGRVDEARYFLILCLYGLGRESEALQAAEKYIIDFPSSEFYADMLLWIGKFHFNRGDFSSSIKYFDNYAKSFPDRVWADASLVWVARAMFNKGDFTAVIETVTRLVKAYPESSRLSEARFVQAEALIELARFDAAILLLDNILENDPESRWGQMALLRKGNCLFALGAGNPLRYEEALAVYLRIAQGEGLTSAMLIEIYYKIGRCLEKLERFDDAVNTYYSEVLLRYIKDRSSGTWYDESTLSLVVRGAFSAAEIFERQGRYEQAVGVLKRIARSDSGAADEAERRIDVIKKIRD